MNDATSRLSDEVGRLMKEQADLLDQLDRSQVEARKERDGLLLDFLEAMDSAMRGLDVIEDSDARGVLEAIERQTELIFAKHGMTTYTFEQGAQAPLGEIDVVATIFVAGLADLAVVRTIHPGLRDNQRIVRKAAVEINKTTLNEEG